MENRTTDPGERSRLRSLGAAIRRARGALTQEELGDRLDLPQTTVSRWELGYVDLGVEQVRRLEEALDLPGGELFAKGGYAGRPEAGGFPVKSDLLGSLEDAIDAVRGAGAMDLGIQLVNRWEPSGPDQRTLVWRIEVTSEPPGRVE